MLPAQPDPSLSNNTPWMNEAIIALVALLITFAVPAIGWWFKLRQRGKAVRSQIGLSYVKEFQTAKNIPCNVDLCPILIDKLQPIKSLGS